MMITRRLSNASEVDSTGRFDQGIFPEKSDDIAARNDFDILNKFDDFVRLHETRIAEDDSIPRRNGGEKISRNVRQRHARY